MERCLTQDIELDMQLLGATLRRRTTVFRVERHLSGVALAEFNLTRADDRSLGSKTIPDMRSRAVNLRL